MLKRPLNARGSCICMGDGRMIVTRALPTHPLFAHEEEERDAEAGHDDEVDGAPLDDVDKQDAEDDDDEVADEAEAAREVELGSRG